ncbi:hypothetical protein SDJN02_23951, partial [Cucurbita argyrosperma subsp. argyrosperma]
GSFEQKLSHPVIIPSYLIAIKRAYKFQFTFVNTQLFDNFNRLASQFPSSSHFLSQFFVFDFFACLPEIQISAKKSNETSVLVSSFPAGDYQL